MDQAWIKKLTEQLTKEYGDNRGKELAAIYGKAFSPSYMYDTPTHTAFSDIETLLQLSSSSPIMLKLSLGDENSDYPLNLRIYQTNRPIALSTILPMLANFGLITDTERTYKLAFDNDANHYISHFTVLYQPAELDISRVNHLFTDAFLHTLSGSAEDDGFNKLVLGAYISWHEVTVLRAYAKYLHQIGFRFSQPYIEQTLSLHPDITKDLIRLFRAMHDPREQTQTDSAKKIEERINTALESVPSLDEDRIYRQMMHLIKATLRTNFFQRDKENKHKHYLSIKFSSRDIPDLALPKPLYEIFVYSPHFEGIHLRNTKVARGGIRWSDRPEDFRTEVLGLMKAQVVKNAVIVPSGAKGGFVLKKSLHGLSRNQVHEEVTKRYTNFIRGLLDLTDNLNGAEVIPPSQVVCHDEPDPYLVVAADKGTATFSDLANSISADYQFWLGDAFASGGSAGYDHKKMGITARGAWESIKRHFREMDIDVMSHDITVVGIGDMAGDVFGNGMLYTNHIKLVAAFNHKHIFIDPDPNPELSYEERKRLFHLQNSSWEDYNSSLISKGGGVFSRSQKAITLTPEMQNILGTDETVATPNELIRIILKAPVDLLFNGGIGTYVKASTQTNADVGDRTNDYCRIDGSELRCKVVGEGGNLGFTQFGRVEYALQGGLINTDFIDNSAGVDCSDHEVNLKILLNEEIVAGRMTNDERNTLLQSLTSEVAQLVLSDNYQQALVMSFSAASSHNYIDLHISHIKELGTLGFFDRRVENFPDDKKLMERKSSLEGLSRPELAILLEYTKIHLKHAILHSTIPEDQHISVVAENAFPTSIRNKYQQGIHQHRLYREIVATQLSNLIVSTMGITYIHRAQSETGASIEDIVRAFTVASQVFHAAELIKLVDGLGFRLPANKQYEMLFIIRNLIHLATRWFLHSALLKGDLQQLITHYSKGVKKLEKIIPDLMAGYTKQYQDELINEFISLGLPPESAQRIATCRAIYTALNIIDVSSREGFDLIKTAEVYFCCGERINMLWFRDQINHDTRDGHWNVLARLTLRDELDAVQRAFTIAILKNDHVSSPSSVLVDHWVEKNESAMARWSSMLSSLHSSTHVDYTMFFIAIRELMSIIMRSMGMGRN